MHKTKTWAKWQTFYYSYWLTHKRAIRVCAICVVIFFIPSISIVSSILGRVRDKHVVEELAYMRYQFVYHQNSNNFLYDFNYLMRALEENWPFFNLSISANVVDVHEVAENMRYILSNPTNAGICVHTFQDLLREHFFWEVRRIGHLFTIWQYTAYFNDLARHDWIINTPNA